MSPTASLTLFATNTTFPPPLLAKTASFVLSVFSAIPAAFFTAGMAVASVPFLKTPAVLLVAALKAFLFDQAPALATLSEA
jgi:hypothetical protein